MVRQIKKRFEIIEKRLRSMCSKSSLDDYETAVFLRNGFTIAPHPLLHPHPHPYFSSMILDAGGGHGRDRGAHGLVKFSVWRAINIGRNYSLLRFSADPPPSASTDVSVTACIGLREERVKVLENFEVYLSPAMKINYQHATLLMCKIDLRNCSVVFLPYHKLNRIMLRGAEIRARSIIR
jgi:hypothetical protein